MAAERYLPGFWRKFRTWFTIRRNARNDGNDLVFRGNDLNGNNFFETKDPSGRLIRIVEPPDLNDWQIPMIPEIVISPEWIRWLRKTREDPPTEEEMVRNAAIALIKKEKAAELEAEERKNWPELDAKLKQLEAERNFHPLTLFPLYRDLMTNPGQEYMINRGFYVPDLNENPSALLEEPKQSAKLSPGDSKKQEISREEPVKLETPKADKV